MFKRLIIGLFTISLVAMFWASAGAQAVYGPSSCQTTDYVDPTTGIGWYICDYYVWFDGKWILSKQWYYWAGGSGIQGLRFKVSNDAKDCVVYDKDKNPNATRCSITSSVMFGTFNKNGSEDLSHVLDYNNYIYGLQFLVNPKCFRKNPPPECGDPPGNTSGNPGLNTSTIPINYDFFDDCVKNGMCQDTVYLPFEVSLCPNDRWECTFIPERFLGLTCNAMFGMGWHPDRYPGNDDNPILVPCGSRDRVNLDHPELWPSGFGICKTLYMVDKQGEELGSADFIEATVTLGFCENKDLEPDEAGNITYQFGDPVGYDCNYNSPTPIPEGRDYLVPSDIYCSGGRNDGQGCYASAPDPDGSGPLTFCSDLFNRGFNPGYQSPLDQ